jgi:hypothetical protein
MKMAIFWDAALCSLVDTVPVYSEVQYPMEQAQGDVSL